MNRLLLSAAVTALSLAITPVMAQGNDNDRDHHPGPSSHQTAPPAGHMQSDHVQNHRGPAPAAQQHNAATPAMRGSSPAMEHRGENQHGPAPDHGAMNHGTANHGPADHRGPANAAPHNRADISHLRRNFTSQHRFHAGSYHAPAGYHHRRWSYGETLPHAYFVRDYWLTNWSAYDLLAPPPGYVWVRVGPDALLIDQFSGEIVRVAYNVFY